LSKLVVKERYKIAERVILEHGPTHIETISVRKLETDRLLRTHSNSDMEPLSNPSPGTFTVEGNDLIFSPDEEGTIEVLYMPWRPEALSKWYLDRKQSEARRLT